MQIWDKRLAKADKFLQRAREHGQKVYSRYKDERENELIRVRRANLFYANVNTIKESLFNSMPAPDVSRLQKGAWEDEPSRVAALILERALRYELHCAKDFKTAVRSAILDRLVPGWGQVWIRFEVDTQYMQVADGYMGMRPTPEEEPVVMPVPGSEQIFIDTVYWEDFLWEPARTWDKVTWVARKLELTKAEVIDRWGEDALNQIEGVKRITTNLTPKEIQENKFLVYEVWDKIAKEVLHIAKGVDEPLDRKEDPYKLKDFFPCPCPLIANPTTSALLPITDYYIAQDQYNQLDVLYARIALMIEAVKVAGVYDASQGQTIGRMLEGQENRLIPVDNWAIYAEKGGAKGMIDWYPVETVVQCLQQLQAQFEAIKGVLYEITGMSDIMRGQSNQYETAAAQQIKAQFASTRIGGYQRDVGEFVTGILRIMAQMIVSLYGDQKMEAIVGPMHQGDQQYVPQAVEILRNQFLSNCKVDIEADSLTQADWALEKTQRMDLVQTISQFLTSAGPMIQQEPQIAPLLIGMLKFSISGFKGASEITGLLDTQLDQLAQQSNNPQPKPPSPEEIKAQAEQQRTQADMQMSQQQQQHDMQQSQMDAQLKQAELQQKMQQERESFAMDMALKQQELDHAKQMAAIELQGKMIEYGLNIHQSAVEHEQSMEQQQESHNQSLEQSESAKKEQSEGD